MPKIIAAIPVPPTEVYRYSYPYGSALAASIVPDLLVGVAITEDGAAPSIILDLGQPFVLLDDDTTTELHHTEWYSARNRRAA